jgi:hypothetical protein
MDYYPSLDTSSMKITILSDVEQSASTLQGLRILNQHGYGEGVMGLLWAPCHGIFIKHQKSWLYTLW